MKKLTIRELLLSLKLCNRDYITKPELTSRIEKVLALHVSAQDALGAPAVFDGGACVSCGDNWPCSTLRILDGEEE